ncbi:histone PARylation factor 1 isoform X1 [Balaenoptera musculus]|uniref:Histone PARylation factor 1 isoform X1 n=1 Tax=Balaenoptera musculus TaxID=9771 RepID=A0A8B8XVG4_BALMU|nr:histone PARylation factor 1 isoform X1 [Balaenoptera musculus]
MVGGGGKRRPGGDGPQEQQGVRQERSKGFQNSFWLRCQLGGVRRCRTAAFSTPVPLSRNRRCEKAVAVKKGKCCEADVPSDLRKEVESHYRLSLPEDFYHFWTFCEGLAPEQPADSLSASLGLRLVGPYDILAGKHKMKKKSASLNFNLHWRFYYDPPEFQTIIIGDCKTEFHMGYFRDSPDELPVFVGTNEAKKNCIIVQNGDNVFAAVKLFLMKKLKEVTDKKKTSLLKTIDEKLTEAARELGFSLEQRTVKMKQRDKKVVTKTFHGAGLVVPVDKNDVGYRELPETDASLRRICRTIVEAPSDAERLKAFAPVQEMMTYVQFANDECDYGMGLELGMDLFCHGSHYFHKVAGQLLPLAYNLLKRNLFAEIIEAHLADRSREDVDQLAA